MVSIDVLNLILPQMGKCAREMVVHNNEGCDILDMDVSLYVTTIEIEKEEDMKNLKNYEFVRNISNLSFF